MTDQRTRAAVFAALHAEGTFVIPNPWDGGTARLLSGLGFPALATTSAGLAFALGRSDAANLVSRDEALRNAAEVVAATDLPVAADLESGFGERLEDVAETIRLAAAAGLVGGSIEDATGMADRPLFDRGVAVERVAAAVEAARALPFPFTVTARAENFIYGRPDLDDTVARLAAYAEAGADVLYAPGLPDADAVRAVCAIGKPVNVLAGPQWTVEQLAGLGVRRISLGSALPRAAMAAVLSAAREIAQEGTFTYPAVPYAEANALMGDS